MGRHSSALASVAVPERECFGRTGDTGAPEVEKWAMAQALRSAVIDSTAPALTGSEAWRARLNVPEPPLLPNRGRSATHHARTLGEAA